ncbi:MAG TPA: type II secretion system F family protein [Trichormus sp.]|jgi:tight adherence protein C
MDALFQYPELILAVVLLIVVMIGSQTDQGEWHWPSWLAQPAKTCLSVAPDSYLIWVSQSLIHAGWRNNLSFGDFASCKMYLPLLTVFLALFVPLQAVLAVAVLIWLAADAVLYFCVKKRQTGIRRSLPQALDLMVLCVDAGLGLDATLQRIASEATGITNALNDELGLLGREILLGMDRERAYRELYNRTGVDELKTLGSALAQANKLGLSIARILRAQSEFMRKRQGQKAEESAMKMPIYMAFPLWFFIMPSLMLLVLGPSLIKFYQHMQVASAGHF